MIQQQPIWGDYLPQVSTIGSAALSVWVERRFVTRHHLFLLEERRLAVGTVVTHICALRFFCRYVLKRRDVQVAVGHRECWSGVSVLRDVKAFTIHCLTPLVG